MAKKTGDCVRCKRSSVRIKARNMCSSCYEVWRLGLNTEDRVWTKTDYPSPDELDRLMQEHQSWNGLASVVGVKRESLRDYLSIRPDLKSRLSKHLRKPYTPEEAHASQRKSSRDWARRWRQANPDEARRVRREQMRSYDSAYRRRWNTYNRALRSQVSPPDALSIEYLSIIKNDPCSYCGAAFQEADHIVPLAGGGTNAWDNFTASCTTCNRVKNARSLLHFMLDGFRPGVWRRPKTATFGDVPRSAGGDANATFEEA